LASQQACCVCGRELPARAMVRKQREKNSAVKRIRHRYVGGIGAREETRTRTVALLLSIWFTHCTHLSKQPVWKCYKVHARAVHQSIHWQRSHWRDIHARHRDTALSWRQAHFLYCPCTIV